MLYYTCASGSSGPRRRTDILTGLQTGWPGGHLWGTDVCNVFYLSLTRLSTVLSARARVWLRYIITATAILGRSIVWFPSANCCYEDPYTIIRRIVHEFVPRCARETISCASLVDDKLYAYSRTHDIAYEAKNRENRLVFVANPILALHIRLMHSNIHAQGDF